MKVLIVDDEPLARARLLRLLESHIEYQVVGQAENGQQAIEQCNQYHPDVILMDIRMPLMDGLEAAKHLAKGEAPPAVIFCTAYNDYALDAFEANAVDYLLKPVNREKLGEALNKAKSLNRVQLSALLESQGSQLEAGRPKRSHISVRSGHSIELIALDSVRYFLADQKYVSVYYYSDEQLKEVLIDESLKELEQEFGERFFRVHRNALVATQHILGLEKTEQGTRLKMANVAAGPIVSRRHVTELRQLLQRL